jgi:hypothetical protein
MVDSQGNSISLIGIESGGEHEGFVWWPATKEFPIGIFDTPLEEASKAKSGTK